jgi:hypothetical protein
MKEEREVDNKISNNQKIKDINTESIKINRKSNQANLNNSNKSRNNIKNPNLEAPNSNREQHINKEQVNPNLYLKKVNMSKIQGVKKFMLEKK